MHVSGPAAHPELLRDADRARVVEVDDRDDRLELELLEGMPHRRSCPLGPQAAPPSVPPRPHGRPPRGGGRGPSRPRPPAGPTAGTTGRPGPRNPGTRRG